MQEELEGLSNAKEIEHVSGNGISFEKIRIPDEDCSNFQIKYKIVNQTTKSESSGYITCFVSPYQRDVSHVVLTKTILIPENSKLFIQMHSALKPTFTGLSFIDYNVFTPSNKFVFISERDRQDAFRLALINLAMFYGIPDYEYDNNQTLFKKLEQLDPPIFSLLKEYLEAYDSWFGFYKDIKEVEEKSGIVMNLTELQQSELTALILNRENTLEALQTKFDELQFEKFKKSQGLDNIDGKIL